MKKPLLVVVDVQNDFMNPTGSLYVKDAENIIDKISELIKFSEKEGYDILYTSDCHYKDAKELSDNPDFINTFPIHCLRDTDGSKLVSEIKKDLLSIDWIVNHSVDDLKRIVNTTNEFLLLKDEFDMFTNPNTDEFIRQLNPSEIIICGVVEGVCVKFAVEGFLKRNFKVTVYEDCIKNLPHLPSLLEDWDSAGVSIKTMY